MGLAALLALIALAPAASPFYVAAHQSGKRTVADPQRFTAIVGYPNQQVAGIPFWRYVKGSRSARADLPERWYAHVAGVRVRDKTFGYYVMNPSSAGWRRYVARRCAPRCFLDGLGPRSVGRTTPRLPLTQREWVTRAAGLVAFVRRHALVLPNSVGPYWSARLFVAASGGRGSTETFDPAHTRMLATGRIWVQELGDCSAKWAAFKRATQGDDHFACHERGHLAWDLGWWNGASAPTPTPAPA